MNAKRLYVVSLGLVISPMRLIMGVEYELAGEGTFELTVWVLPGLAVQLQRALVRP